MSAASYNDLDDIFLRCFCKLQVWEGVGTLFHP